MTEPRGESSYRNVLSRQFEATRTVERLVQHQRHFFATSGKINKLCSRISDDLPLFVTPPTESAQNYPKTKKKFKSRLSRQAETFGIQFLQLSITLLYGITFVLGNIVFAELKEEINFKMSHPEPDTISSSRSILEDAQRTRNTRTHSNIIEETAGRI